jgi:hypothetical protein
MLSVPWCFQMKIFVITSSGRFSNAEELDANNICPTQRAPDWWESARFQAVYAAQSWFRQGGVVLSHPPAGNASRWHAPCKTKIRLDIRHDYYISWNCCG